MPVNTKISICPDCSHKIFYKNKHQCIKYEPCGMEEQRIADEKDEILNSNFASRFMCNGVKYHLTFTELPKIPEHLKTNDVYVEEKSKKNFDKFYCECGQLINTFNQDNHNRSAKHRKKMKTINKGILIE